MSVAVLFARRDSIYKSLPGVDVWDEERDARKWPGGVPVVAHPPCRGWGKLRRFAKTTLEELQLAPYAVAAVQTFGGVLEHPAGSQLWKYCGLPYPGNRPDAHGGFTLAIDQFDFGHAALKPTWLYIVRKKPLPLPRRAGVPQACIRRSANSTLPEVSKSDRERTPKDLALWMVTVARGG